MPTKQKPGPKPKPPQPPRDPTDWNAWPVTLNTSEAASLMAVHRNSVMRLIKNDPTFPVRRLGRNYRISREALRAWLAGNDNPEGSL